MMRRFIYFNNEGLPKIMKYAIIGMLFSSGISVLAFIIHD